MKLPDVLGRWRSVQDAVPALGSVLRRGGAPRLDVDGAASDLAAGAGADLAGDLRALVPPHAPAWERQQGGRDLTARAVVTPAVTILPSSAVATAPRLPAQATAPAVETAPPRRAQDTDDTGGADGMVSTDGMVELVDLGGMADIDDMVDTIELDLVDLASAGRAPVDLGAVDAETIDLRGAAAGPVLAVVRATTAEVRAWARGNGFAVNDKGRLAKTVLAAYRAAHEGVLVRG